MNNLSPIDSLDGLLLGNYSVASATTIFTAASADEAQARVEQLQQANGGCYAAQYIPGT